METDQTAVFETSSKSSGSGQCVAVAILADGRVLVRDSKDPDGPVLRFSRDEWVAFVGDDEGGVKAGEFDV